MSHVPIPPADVGEILKASLTERGMRQWWFTPNRYLGGARPCEMWTANARDEGTRRVREAAHAFDGGLYV